MISVEVEVNLESSKKKGLHKDKTNLLTEKDIIIHSKNEKRSAISEIAP